jgi:WD40 repeat protein
MTRAGRCALLLLGAGGVLGCHAESDLLNTRDGGAGVPAGVAGATAGAGGGGGGAGSAGGAAGRATGTGGAGNGAAFPTGIGNDWVWSTGVVAHTAGPYAPCGIIGAGTVIFGAANPTAPEIAAASRAGVVLFYSPSTGEQVRPPHYVAGAVTGVDYSRDGTEIVVAGDTGVQLVRLADDKVLFNAQPFSSVASAAALSPDGTLIAVLGRDVGADATVLGLKLVRVSDGTSFGDVGTEAPDGVPPQFSSDGKLVLFGGFILSVPDLQIVAPSPLDYSHTSPTHAVLSPDGTKVAEGGHVIDLASGQEVKTPKVGQDWLYWSAFSPDGTVYAEADADIHLWRTSDWTPIGTPTPVPTPPGGSGSGWDGRFFFSGDGTQLITTVATGAANGNNRLVFQIINVPDLTAGAVIAEPQFLWSPAFFSPDGSLILGVLAGVSGAVWQTADLSLLSLLSERSPPFGFLGNGMLQIDNDTFNPRDGTKLGYATGSQVSPDGRLAVTASPHPKSSVIRLSDLSTQAVLDTSPLNPYLVPVWAFSRDNHVVAVAGQDPTGNPKVIVFDALTGATLATLDGVAPIAITTTSSGAVRVAAFVPVDAGFVANVRVWSVPDGSPMFDIPQATATNYPPDTNFPTVAFSPDGSLIVAGAAGIRIFQVETGALRESHPAHFDPQVSGIYAGVYSLGFSPTGEIATVGWDGTMRFWCSP